MPHLKCPSCETRLYRTDCRAEPIGDLCSVCGSRLVPVGDLGEIVRYGKVETSGSASHRGATVAGQLIVDPVAEITARRGLGPPRASITPEPREPFVASVGGGPTDGPSGEGEEHAAGGRAVDAGRPTRGDAQRLLDLLSAAARRPVAFATLARAGVGSSAAVTCQLELVGAPVRRVYEHGRPVGARLDIDTQRPSRQLATPPRPGATSNALHRRW